MSTNTDGRGGQVVPLGRDGTPRVEDPIVAAERAADLAAELGVLVEQLLGVQAWQDDAVVRLQAGSALEAGYLADVRRVNARTTRTLRVVGDCLAEQRVSCAALADRLRRARAGSVGTGGDEAGG
jgi:hypothetical protein